MLRIFPQQQTSSRSRQHLCYAHRLQRQQQPLLIINNHKLLLSSSLFLRQEASFLIKQRSTTTTRTNQHLFPQTTKFTNIIHKMSTSTTTTPPSTKSGQFDRVENPIVPNGYQMISEGTAHQIHVQQGEVFYNKVQVINRDLSTLVIQVFDQVRRREHEQAQEQKRQKMIQRLQNQQQQQQQQQQNGSEQQVQQQSAEIENIKILEALSATGLRAIRYWKEIPNIDHIIANDLLPDAVEAIRRNVQFNQVDENCVRPNLADATEFMYTHRKPELQYHVVDLDPYGGADIFIDGAVQSVKDGGLLCVTCTDMAVLAGNQAGTCFAKYGAYPLPLKSCHEQALRILLAAIQTSASKYKRYVEPLVCFSIDFYVRVFVRIHVSPAKVKKIHANYGNVIMCMGCDAFHFEPVGKVYDESNNDKSFKKSASPHFTTVGSECAECGGKHKIGGPIWSAPIHNVEFLDQCLAHLEQNKERFNTVKRMTGLLTAAKKEIPDAPLFHDYNHICSKIKCSSPPVNLVRSAILNAGYRVSQTHCKANGIKTDAPIKLVYDIFREWVKTHPSRIAGTDTPGGRILAKEVSTPVNFELRPEAVLDSRHTKIPIFLPNPEENWGPGRRAKGAKKRDRDADVDMEEVTAAPDSLDETPANKQAKVDE